ncbi:bifunctional heptose 7-phosphate kinase/heptose 1-phosphate adenyltransferase [Sporomusa sp. KB1]|uniref:bifunctional heptose 7-phosphate kinase/heptose 1-phosphate adenyltransferase n=1 Tax=Sporomusa sp. KB1 TaxID=943346 RepID=UPI00119E8952|nr:PfkB family carbohydrate kinase [Sporomusa sp. KB1]TWH47607.1 rfaE bifunctional protein kinase chain/domain [Sporomusa sp. KB1]
MNTTLLRLITKLQNRKIMVIGDMVADVYVEGKISRISREAPVLILEHMAETVVPGGAANAVHNTAALGGCVYAVGVVGEDYAGQQLTQHLQMKQVNTNGIIIDPSRPTITKTRVMAGGQATVRQQVVRIDREKKEPLSGSGLQAVKNYILSHIENMAGVILSDYGSQTVLPGIIRSVIDGCQRAGIPCIVDSRYNIKAYTGVTVVKQNESEAAAAVGYEIVDENTLVTAGWTILERLNAQAVLITCGPDGMTLFEASGKVSQIPVTNKSAVYDVTGAGDTVVAAMILALAAGASYLEAARLANFAAGIVVRKLGTATTTPDELAAAISRYQYQV